MGRKRILIVENSDDLRELLESTLASDGHDVVAIGDRVTALDRTDLATFDIIISDLAGDLASCAPTLGECNCQPLLGPVSPLPEPGAQTCIIKTFKLVATNSLRLEYNREELREIVERVLEHKLSAACGHDPDSHVHERIEFDLPSDVSLMNGVLNFLTERVATFGVVEADTSNLFVALDEAFVNAVKHGNKNDPAKLIRIAADLSPTEACFTVEDEGEGFDVQSIPDPRDPENLFKSNGRGVLLICNIMDEVEYNARGNQLRMVKRSEPSLQKQTIDSFEPADSLI